MTRAALYARVSSAIQRDRHTIESQLRVLPAFASSRGWMVVATFIDDGRTAKAGFLERRDGLAELLAGAAAHDFDVVVIVDLDRLSRSEDIIERAQILGALQRARVLVAIEGSGAVLDLNTDEGDLQVALGGYFSAAWGRKHRKRVVEGKLTAIAKGKKPAGPTPYGYRYDRMTGVWSIDELAAEVIREIYRRALAGDTADMIAEDLHVRGIAAPRTEWDRATIYRILAQPAYRGEWIADKRRKLSVAVPPIVEPEIWYAVRDRCASKRGLRRTMHFYLCEGLAVCELCGGKMLISSANKGRNRVRNPAKYVCANRRRPARGSTPCPSRYWLCSEVDDRVWEVVAKFVAAPGRLERVSKKALTSAGVDANTMRDDLAAAEKRIDRLVKAEAGILARYQAGTISDEAFDMHLDKSRRDRRMAEAQLEAARRAQVAAGRATTRAAGLAAMIAELRELATSPSPAKRRELVERVLPPGSVTLSIATITLDALLEVGRADPAGLVAAAGYSRVDEATLRFRLVA